MKSVNQREMKLNFANECSNRTEFAIMQFCVNCKQQMFPFSPHKIIKIVNFLDPLSRFYVLSFPPKKTTKLLSFSYFVFTSRPNSLMLKISKLKRRRKDSRSENDLARWFLRQAEHSFMLWKFWRNNRKWCQKFFVKNFITKNAGFDSDNSSTIYDLESKFTD